MTTASQKYRQGSFLPSEKIRPIGQGTSMEKQEVLVTGDIAYDDLLAMIKKTGKEVSASVRPLKCPRY